MQNYDEMKAVFMKAFAGRPASVHPEMEPVIAGLKCLIEADCLKTFFAGATLAQKAKVPVPDFCMALIQYHTLEIAMLMKTDQPEVDQDMIRTMTMCFAMYLQRSMKLMRTVRGKEKE